jgi:alanine racemase
MNKNKRLGLRTWIEVDIKALKHNLQVFRSLLKPQCLLMAVVKSNAYGHGLVGFSQVADKLGVNYFGVDSAIEGITLRKNGIEKPILVLGYTLSEMIERAVANNISLSISSFSALNTLIKLKLKKPVKIHIKVDTGMHRQGFLLNESNKLIEKLQANKKKIIVEGLFTHFASAKNPSFPSYTLKQIEMFNHWKGIFKNNGFNPICHASASAGVILFPQAQFDMVRIGAGFYGIWPSTETKSYAESKFKLQPVLSWRTILAEIKNLPKGSQIGYDCAETLEKDSVIGICPIGYWHGYPRNLSSIGKVLIKGHKTKILGRISMDMIIIDLTGIKNIKVGDEVTLIGRDGKEEIGLEEVAMLADTSTYEIADRLNPLIERIYF